MSEYLSRKHTTVCRGIAIVAVVFCHVCAVVLPASVARLSTPLGGGSVAIFLILSGYGLNESYKSKGLDLYWNKKIHKVVLPYLVAFAFYAAFMWDRLGRTELVLLLFTLTDRTDSYFWYVGYQMLCYIAFFIAVRFTRDIRIRYAILVLFALTSFIFFNELRAEQSLSFFLGVAISDFLKQKQVLSKKIVLCSLSGVFICALALKQIPEVRQSNELVFKFVQMIIKLSYAFVVMGLGQIFVNAQCFLLLKRLFVFWGTVSYEVYLSHAVAMLSLLLCGVNWISVFVFFIATSCGTAILFCIGRMITVGRKKK